MNFFNKCALPILLVTFVSIMTIVEANDHEQKLPGTPGNTENALNPTERLRDLSISTNDGKSRVKRQFGGYYDYDPYYDRRRVYPYPPIIFGGIGIGGFGGGGFGRGFGGRGFGGRGFGGRGIGGRGIGGRGIGGRGGGGGHGGGRG